MTSFNCYWCDRFIGYSYKDNDVCDYCRFHRPKPPQSNGVTLSP
jgi:2-iminoacetate synthase ThiH